MIICGQCGERNPAGTRFCRACNGYLEWDGARAAEPVPAVGSGPGPGGGPGTGGGPVPGPGPGPGPVPRGPGAGQGQYPPPGFIPHQVPGPGQVFVPGHPAAPGPGPGPIPGPGQPPTARPRPQQPTEPRPLQPAEPQPQQSHRRPGQQDDRPLLPGDLICGRCGIGNPPDRKFCRRCAAPLLEAAVVPRPSWWRRLVLWFQRRFGRLRRIRRTGERPKTRRSPVRTAISTIFRVLRWAVVVLLTLSLLGIAFVPSVRGWVTPTASSAWSKAKSVFSQKLVPVRPTGVTSNGERPEHPAGLASDGVTTTYWSVPESAAEPILVFTFERPVDLKQLIVHNGAAEDFQTTHRPRDLHLVFSTGAVADLTLIDKPDRQTVKIPVDADGATSVEVHVVSLYHAVQGPDLALAEIEFFEQRN